MKITYILLLLSFTLSVSGQETFYRAIPNLVNAEDRAGKLHVELNYQFSTVQGELIYNLTNKYFLFGTYNFDNSNRIFKTFIFRDRRTLEKSNSGYSIGAGMKKLGAIGNYENLELLTGFEKQKVNNIEYFTDSPSQRRDNLIQDYYKIFAQFNMMKSRTNFDFGYSLKVSYFKLTKLENSMITDVFQGKSLVFLDPTVNFNYKFFAKKNLILSHQVGLSLPLTNLEETSGGNNPTARFKTYLAIPIIKLGIQYRFGK